MHLWNRFRWWRTSKGRHRNLHIRLCLNRSLRKFLALLNSFPAQPDALPVTTLDESAILDPDIEWTDHEYGKSLESIDESLEEINREDTEMDVAPPSPIMIDVDNLLAPAEHEALEEQKDILSDEKVGVQRAEDVAVTEESRELPALSLRTKSKYQKDLQQSSLICNYFLRQEDWTILTNHRSQRRSSMSFTKASLTSRRTHRTRFHQSFHRQRL